MPRTHPVIEIFGPTIQGEGAEAGVPTHFIRLGGCDYRCSWCDTLYAVDPATVRDTAVKRSAEEIVRDVAALPGRPEWVAISGGNPALHDAQALVDGLHVAGFKVAVETQGSLFKPWLNDVERLTVSPKPPSSGMASPAHDAQLEAFLAQARRDTLALKFVCFDGTDLAWAKERMLEGVPTFLSAGTPVPATRDGLADSYRRLCEAVAADPELAHVRVLPQLHVIAWGDARGV